VQFALPIASASLGTFARHAAMVLCEMHVPSLLFVTKSGGDRLPIGTRVARDMKWVRWLVELLS
jgi:hypothetical protein